MAESTRPLTRLETGAGVVLRLPGVEPRHVLRAQRAMMSVSADLDAGTYAALFTMFLTLIAAVDANDPAVGAWCGWCRELVAQVEFGRHWLACSAEHGEQAMAS